MAKSATVKPWFNYNTYMANKLAQMQAAEPTAGWTADSLKAAFEKAGFYGDTGAQAHFNQYGHKEDVSPNKMFDATYYYQAKALQWYQTEQGGSIDKQTILDDIENYGKKMEAIVKGVGLDAWTHYTKYGTAEGINPTNDFDTSDYMAAKLAALQAAEPSAGWTMDSMNAAFKKAGINALAHYMTYAGKGDNEVPAGSTFDVPEDERIDSGAGDSYTLTVNADVATANVFNGPRGWTPGGTDQVNTLNDDDVLTGSGTNPTLNLTFVDDADTGVTTVTPKMTGVQTINVTVIGDADKTLNLEDSTGETAVNVYRVNKADSTFTADNMATALSKMSVNDSHAENANVQFLFLKSALTGTEDSAEVTLNNVDLGNLVIQQHGNNPTEGYESLTLTSSGSANEVDQLVAEDLQSLTIAGDQDLSLGEMNLFTTAPNTNEYYQYTAGLGNVAGSLEKVDASAFTGNLTLVLGAEVNATKDGTSGTLVDFAATGGSGNDTFVLSQAVANTKATIDGGEGETDTVRALSSVTAGAYTNVEVADLRGQDAANALTFNAALFDENLKTIMIRNEGQGTITLNNLTADQFAGLQAQHAITGQDTLAGNVYTANLQTDGTSDTAAISFKDQLDSEVRNINDDPRFNFQLVVNQAENLTIDDQDTESNTVRAVAENASTATALANTTTVDAITGTLTVTGGASGTFLNLDSTVNNDGGLYGFDVEGTSTADPNTVTDITTTEAARYVASTINAGEFAGNLIVRVGDGLDAEGTQNITTGSGNDTVIFDDLADATAGLTKADSVDGGDGTDTLVFDGQNSRVSIGASEWTNVKNFETIRLVGNGMPDNNGLAQNNAYNLKLTNDLLSNNGTTSGNGKTIAIINDNDDLNTSRAVQTALSENDGVTIDARELAATNSFSYDGQETDATVGSTMTADRFIMADANINGSAVIDGGYNGYNSANGNDDVLEARNASVVTVADLANVKNVGRIEFTNDTAVLQNNKLVLDNATIDRLVNSTHTATADEQEVLTVAAVANVIDGGGTVSTGLDMDLRQVTGQTVAVNADLTLDNAGGRTNAGNDTVRDTLDYTSADTVIAVGAGTDEGVFSGKAATLSGGTYDSSANPAYTEVTADGIDLTANYAIQFTSASGATQVFAFSDDATDGLGAAGGVLENLDLSDVTGLGALTITTNEMTTSLISGEGADTIKVTASKVASGSLSVDGGAGNDQIDIDAPDAAAINTVFTFSGGEGNDSITLAEVSNAATDNNTAFLYGGEGNDTITLTDNANNKLVTIDAGAGADSVVITAGGNQLIVAGKAGDSLAATATTFAGDTIAAADTVTFGSGIDTITGFITGSSVLDVSAANVAPTNLAGADVDTVLASGVTYVLYGTMAAGAFTVAADYAGGTNDAIICVGDGSSTVATATGWTFLDDLGAALAAADFA